MLDVSTQAALLEAIAAVQDERELGVLLITHDRVLADAWCGEIADVRELSGGGGGEEVEAPAEQARTISALVRGEPRRSARP